MIVMAQMNLRTRRSRTCRSRRCHDVSTNQKARIILGKGEKVLAEHDNNHAGAIRRRGAPKRAWGDTNRSLMGEQICYLAARTP